MADFDTCYAFVDGNEDALDQHKQVTDRCPKNVAGPCYAISGINSGAFPAQFAAIAALPQSQRGPAVQQFYQTQIWDRWFGAIVSNDLAMRVFDSAVNQGEHRAVTLLQQAVNSLGGAQIEDDGEWGPITLAAVNNQNPAMLLAAFQAMRYAWYKDHNQGRPELPALLARAMK